VTWEFLYPCFSPWERAPSQHCFEASISSGNWLAAELRSAGRPGAAVATLFVAGPMLFSLALCILITSKNGSRLMYQPGQADPGMFSAVVTPRRVCTVSVMGANGWHCSAILDDWR